MGKTRKITTKLCSKCKYRCRVGNFGHNGRIACNYLDVAGKSRIFVNGEQVIPTGYCDKYEYGEESFASAKKWCNENFSREVGIKREGVTKWET